jgi:hypothetical protein
MPHELPKLRYDFSALEPHIDTRPSITTSTIKPT